MERTAFTIVALLLGLLTACTSTERGGLGINRVEVPEWTRTGHHPDFPESDYLVAYGLARTEREATEIAEGRLEVMICDYAVRRHPGFFKDTQFEAVVTEPAAWFQLSEFGEAVGSDAAGDGFEAVVARAIRFNELKLRARSLLIEAQKAFDQATQPPMGLGSIARRMELWGNYYLLGVRVVALELLATGALNQRVFDAVEGALISLWELPTISQVSQWGGDQHLRIREGLAEPIGLRVYFRGKPVAGVPLAWSAGPGFQGAIEGDRELDEQGMGTAKVLYITPTGDEFAYVQAYLDLDRLIGRRLGISMNVWLWKVMLPSRLNGELLVNIEETEQGKEPAASPVFYPELEKWCVGRNLAVSTGKPRREDKLYHLRLEGKVDVTTKLVDKIPSAYVSGVLTLSDVETGQTLFTYTLALTEEGKEGNTEAAIRLLAIRRAAGEALGELAARIIATLPFQGDEFGREE